MENDIESTKSLENCLLRMGSPEPKKMCSVIAHLHLAGQKSADVLCEKEVTFCFAGCFNMMDDLMKLMTTWKRREIMLSMMASSAFLTNGSVRPVTN